MTGLTVEIMESGREFRITAYTGRIDSPYLARFPRCYCERPVCVAPDGHVPTHRLVHPNCPGGNRSAAHRHCHVSRSGYHREHIERIAEILATGKGLPSIRYGIPTASPMPVSYREQKYVPAPSWPDWSLYKDKPFAPWFTAIRAARRSPSSGRLRSTRRADDEPRNSARAGRAGQPPGGSARHLRPAQAHR